jgi:FAD/FMN-containing dehydrogenase
MSRRKADFPDPNGDFSRDVKVDDVTRMNATGVSAVFHPRGPEDIQQVIALARKQGTPISIRGTRHCMGAHTIAARGFVIDCRRLRCLSFDPSTRIVTTGPGNTWADLIRYLNQFGFSPRTMQSYSTFSVGGSIAVGAHGITTDMPVSESVLWLKLVDAQATLIDI